MPEQIEAGNFLSETLAGQGITQALAEHISGELMTEYLNLSSLPFPVAYPLHFARTETDEMPVSGRWDNAVFAVYQTMRLAALLMLAD